MKNYLLNHKAGERAFALSGLIAVAASVMTIYTVSYSTPAAAGPMHCKQSITSDYKKAKSQSKAKEKARSNWRWKVRANGGTLQRFELTNWNYAQNRIYSCKKSGKKWACYAHATPCVPL